MTSNKGFAQQTRHKRFQAQAGAFAVLRGTPKKLGIIIEIGRDGLAFRYMASEDISKGPFELDLLMANHDFALEKVPFKIISDAKIPNETPFSSMKMRRCDVQFGKLTKKQISQLGYFIGNFTKDEA